RNFFGFTKPDLTRRDYWRSNKNGKQPRRFTKNWWRPMGRAVRRPMRDLANCVWSISSGNNGRKVIAIVIVLCPEMLHTPDMKKPFRLSRLVGWMGRWRVALMALAFCASAFADPSKNVVATPKFQASKMQTATRQEV